MLTAASVFDKIKNSVVTFQNMTYNISYTVFFLLLKQLLMVQIKSFIILAVLRRSGQRVGGDHLCVIEPGNPASFKKMLQRRRAAGNTASDLPARDLNIIPPAPETNALRSTN